ncbi:MAG: lipoyl(octanoyl) transferase LipB [Pseudomonadota bacterium]
MQIWRSKKPVEYSSALARMEDQAAAIAAGNASDTLWFLEHPPIYTAGTSADRADLLGLHPFPVYDAGRGGQYTYHGPGQRIVYTMIDLKHRGRDVRRFVRDLEDVIINALAAFDVTGERREGRVGVWVETPAGEKKIAALGIRVRRWVSFHGISINLCPDLSHFGGIVPCGLPNFGVTSLHDHGKTVSFEDLDEALLRAFERVFGAAPEAADVGALNL